LTRRFTRKRRRPARRADGLRLTTQQALKTLDDMKLRGKKKKDWEDRIAAVIILSTYLERKRGEADGHEGA
jgi:RNase H-fold protein (predicted Holliday junction resolvase)